MLDGLQWKTLLKWMIWGENPLFSETSMFKLIILWQLLDVGCNACIALDHQQYGPPRLEMSTIPLSTYGGWINMYAFLTFKGLHVLTQPQDHEIKVCTFYTLFFCTKCIIPKSLKVSHWLSKYNMNVTIFVAKAAKAELLGQTSGRSEEKCRSTRWNIWPKNNHKLYATAKSIWFLWPTISFKRTETSSWISHS